MENSLSNTEHLILLNCMIDSWSRVRDENSSESLALSVLSKQLATWLITAKGVNPEMALRWADKIATSPPDGSRRQVPFSDAVLEALAQACPPWQSGNEGWGWVALARWASGTWASDTAVPGLLEKDGAPEKSLLSTKLIRLRTGSEVLATALGWGLKTIHGRPQFPALLAALTSRGVDVNVPVTAAGDMALSMPAADAAAVQALIAVGADPLLADARGVPASLQWLSPDAWLRPFSWEAGQRSHAEAIEKALAANADSTFRSRWFQALDTQLGVTFSDPKCWTTSVQPLMEWAHKLASRYGHVLTDYAPKISAASLRSASSPEAWNTLSESASQLRFLLPSASWKDARHGANDRAWCWLALCQTKNGPGGHPAPEVWAAAADHLGTLPVGPPAWNVLRRLKSSATPPQFERLNALEQELVGSTLEACLTQNPSFKNAEGGWMEKAAGRALDRASGRLGALLHTGPEIALAPQETARSLSQAWALIALTCSKPETAFKVLRSWEQACAVGTLTPSCAPDRPYLSEVLSSPAAHQRRFEGGAAAAAAWERGRMDLTCLPAPVRRGPRF